MSENFSNQVIETLQSLRYQSNELQVQVNGKEKTIPLQNTAPSSPSSSDLWIDSSDPLKPILKVYDGSSWLVAGSSLEVESDQLIISSRMFG